VGAVLVMVRLPISNIVDIGHKTLAEILALGYLSSGRHTFFKNLQLVFFIF
jgi:hypothetical protein